MNRRDFIRLLSMGTAGLELDLDRLLWVPGEKKIFLIQQPKLPLNVNQIILEELQRIQPFLNSLFEQDDRFYEALSKVQNG